MEMCLRATIVKQADNCDTRSRLKACGKKKEDQYCLRCFRHGAGERVEVVRVLNEMKCL